MTDAEAQKLGEAAAAEDAAKYNHDAPGDAALMKLLAEPTKGPTTEDMLKIGAAAAAGAGVGYGMSGARFGNPTNPNYQTMTESRLTPKVERMAKVPPGTVSQVAAASTRDRVPTVAEMAERLRQSRVNVTNFNNETERLAANARRGMANAGELAAKGLVDANGNPFYAKATEATKGAGLLLDPKLAAEVNAAAAGKETTEAAKALSATRTAGGLATLGKVLPGAGAGLSLYDAYNRGRAGDYSGAAVSGISGGLSLAAPWLSLLGIPAQVANDNPEMVQRAIDAVIGPPAGVRAAESAISGR
jgi:hypothetical protein